jgi:hypothetical protein
VGNGVTISNNLSANQVDQQLETPRKVFSTEQRHPWIKQRPTNHTTPQVTLIIPCEVQICEA